VRRGGRTLCMIGEKFEVDVGVPIRTIMTRKEALESGILVGDEVKVAFEAGAAQIRPRDF